MKADLSKLVKGLSVNVDFSFDFNNVYVKKYGKTSDMFLFNSDGSYTHKAFASALGFGDELSVYNIYHRDWCHSIDYVQTAYNTYELQPLNALAQYAKQETPVFNAGDAAGQNCQDLKWLKAINEKIDANQYYVYERHDNGVVYNYKTDKVWKQVDNPLKNGYPRGVTTMAFFRIAK